MLDPALAPRWPAESVDTSSPGSAQEDSLNSHAATQHTVTDTRLEMGGDEASPSPLSVRTACLDGESMMGPEGSGLGIPPLSSYSFTEPEGAPTAATNMVQRVPAGSREDTEDDEAQLTPLSVRTGRFDDDDMVWPGGTAFGLPPPSHRGPGEPVKEPAAAASMFQKAEETLDGEAPLTPLSVRTASFEDDDIVVSEGPRFGLPPPYYSHGSRQPVGALPHAMILVQNVFVPSREEALRVEEVTPLSVRAASMGGEQGVPDHSGFGFPPPHSRSPQPQPRPPAAALRFVRNVPASSDIWEPQSVLVARMFDAISRDDFAEVHRLLRAGTNPNVFTSKGTHVLFRAAARATNPAIVTLLLGAGANPRASDAAGNEVLHFWSRARKTRRDHDLHIGRALILAGANTNASRKNDGMTPLHHVVVRFNGRRGWGDIQRALLLVSMGADIAAQTTSGQTPRDLLRPGFSVSGERLAELLRQGVASAAAPRSLPACAAPHWGR